MFSVYWEEKDKMWSVDKSATCLSFETKEDACVVGGF